MHQQSKRVVRCAFALTIALLVSSCGFTLKSSELTTLPAVRMQILSAQSNSAFEQQSRQSLQYAGVQILESNTDYTLRLGEEQTNTRTLSVNGRARAAQYEVQLAVEVSLSQGDTLLFGPETLATERTYFEDTANIAGSNEERELLLTEMRQTLVDQLLRRLRAASDAAGAR